MPNISSLSAKDTRFARVYEATLRCAALSKEQVRCSKGSLKRWADLLQVITAYANKSDKISPIRWALDSLHWGLDHSDSMEAAEAELVNALLDELQNGTDAVRSWRRNAVFIDLVTDTFNSVHPLGKTWRWIYTDSFSHYLRARTRDMLFHKEVAPQNIDLFTASNYEIRYEVRVARARQEWQAFEASLCRLLPEIQGWPIHKRRNEREILCSLKVRYGIDYVIHQRDFSFTMSFLNALWSKNSGGLSSFLRVQHFSQELARGIWSENTQKELERLFLRARAQLAAHKSHGERDSRFTYRYDSYGEILRSSWLFHYITACYTSGTLTPESKLKVSKALMELSMGLL